MSNKFKTLDELQVITAQARADHKKVVLTNGCFDIVHRGHVHLLRAAKQLGDILIVALNSDRSVTDIKGPARPVLPETDRVELLGAMEMVDYITLFDEPDPYKLIAEIKPDVLVKGGDWEREKIVGREFVEARGGRVLSVPLRPGFSTSGLLERIRAGRSALE